MKIYQIFCMFFLVAVFDAHAQFAIGARAGFHLTNMSNKDGFSEHSKWKPGFQVGVVGDYALSDAFSIQPGILFATQGNKTERSSDFEILNSRMRQEIRTTLNINYIKVPVNVQYKLNITGMNLLFQAGPYFGYGLGMRMKTEIIRKGVMDFGFGIEHAIDEKDFFDERFKMGSGDNMLYRAFDFGLGFGTGVQFGNMQVVLGYNMGILNIVNKNISVFQGVPLPEDILNDAIVKNHGLTLSLIYLFGN